MGALIQFDFGLRDGAVGVIGANEGAGLVVLAGFVRTEDVNDFSETDSFDPKWDGRRLTARRIPFAHIRAEGNTGYGMAVKGFVVKMRQFVAFTSHNRPATSVPKSRG